jgi:futalosine hydrolase
MILNILIVVSVDAEKQAVVAGLEGDNRFTVIVGGVGAVTVAANTSKELAINKYSYVINMGIAGGFIGKVEVGSLVIANEIIAADLGTETAEGFQTLEQLELGCSRIQCDSLLANRLVEGLSIAGITYTQGSILTISTVTGTATIANELMRRNPMAIAEAMEGFGAATAAKLHEVPVLEIRTISNTIGPRDRASWRIKDALDKLQQVSTVLKEVL